MAALIHLVCGPARTGKTRFLLAKYRQVLATGGGAGLWLAPTERSAADIRGRLLGPGLSACLGPGVTTFDRFATSILHAAGGQDRPISDLMKRQLIADLVKAARREKRLVYFNRVVETAGLIDLLAEFISELKRLEIWPDQLRQACQTKGLTPKDRDLIYLYEAYQQRLVEHGLYDAEGRFWSARTMLREQGDGVVGDLRTVVVDGFTDFTRTQHEMLELLAERCREVYLSLSLDLAGDREELFAKSRQTLDRLRKRHPRLRVVEMSRPSETHWPAMAHLEAELFRNPRDARPAGETSGLEIIAATRSVGEIEAIARRIKKLLIFGDESSGDQAVRPQDIAVVFRSLGDSAPLVSEVFGRFGIPVAIEAGTPMSRHPLLKALLGFLELQAEDWPFRRLLSVVSNNFFQPSWPEAAEAEAFSATERMVRWLQIASGRDALLDALKRYADEPNEDAAGDAAREARRERRRQQARRAATLLSRLAEALDRLPSRGTPRQWSEALTKLTEELGLLRCEKIEERGEPGIDRDEASLARVAWDRLISGLEGEQQLAAWQGQRPPRFGLSELRRRVIDLLHVGQIPPSHDEVGRVRVLSAISLRTLSVPYLFVAGLSERAFPPSQRADRVYSETEYQRLADAKLPVVLRAEQSQQEMLLFYEVVTRAEKRLVLSYPALDEKLQPLLPSPYLPALQRACGNVEVDEQVELSPVPKGPPLLNRDELRLHAVAAALDGQPAELAAMLQSAELTPVARNVLAAIEAIKSRADRKQFGPFEGLLTTDAAREQLAPQFGIDKCWSPSELERYATCPFRFFLERVLRVEPLTELALETDYAGRGRLLHETLARFHRGLRDDEAALEAILDSPDDFEQQCAEIMGEILGELVRIDPLEAALQEVDRRTLLLLSSLYAGQYAAYRKKWKAMDHPPQPAHFEVSFGQTETESDPISRAAPLEIRAGELVIRIAGRIDRIDVGQTGDQTVFTIVDYKTGEPPTPPKHGGEIDGTALQLELYSMAAAELLASDQLTVGLEAGYWGIKGKDKGYKTYLELSTFDNGTPLENTDWKERRGLTIEKVVQIVRGVRGGHFPVFSLDKKCTGRCPMHTVCRIQQIRSLGKTWTTSDPLISETNHA